MLRRGKSARIEGRDLGQKLLGHTRKANPTADRLDLLLVDLDEYEQHQCNLLASRGKDTEAALLSDEIKAVRVLIERCLEQGRKHRNDLETLCNELFVDEASKQNCIVLSSVHKSKGLEWKKVYLLGKSDYMPFFKAEQEWELEQERNLIYVAVTRAQHELIYVTNVEAGLKAGLHRDAPRATPKKAVDDLEHQANEFFYQNEVETNQ